MRIVPDAGFICGLPLSAFTLDHRTWSFEVLHRGGKSRKPLTPFSVDKQLDCLGVNLRVARGQTIALANSDTSDALEITIEPLWTSPVDEPGGRAA